MVGNPSTDPLMGPFLIEVIVIFLHHSRQLPAIKDECMVQAFSTIRSELLWVRSEMTPDIKDSVAGLAHCLIFLLKLKKIIFPNEDVVDHALLSL